MKKVCLIFTLLLTLLLSVTASAAELEISDDGFVEVEGLGEAGQPYVAGLRAAEVMAYRRAAEEIGSIQIDSETNVSNGINLGDNARAQIHSIINRAKIVKEYQSEDGRYHAIVRIPVYGAQSIARVVMPRHEKVEPFPQPVQPVQTVRGGYTGVIIDCRGLGLVTAMSPVIKDSNGNKIYGYKNLDCDYVIQNGMASYNNERRAGSNPLRIKAVNVDGLIKPCDPVISISDASLLLAENSKAHFLNKCAVVFLR